MSVFTRKTNMKKGDDCDQCDGIFSQKNNSYVHKKSKHGGSKYDWNQCDSSYSFTQKSNLDTHKKLGGLKYNFNQCYSSYSSYGYLTIHKQSMRDCDNCDNAFKYRHKHTKHEGVK